MLNNIIEKYSRVAYGSMIEDENLLKELRRVINYLIDNDYDEAFIISYLLYNGPVLDRSLWDNSLLEPDKVYYHSQLTIMPGPAIWSPTKKEHSQKFFLEMRINYTIDDLLNYYYNEFLIPIELRNTYKDKKAFEHMLKNYKKFNDFEAIDFILYLIDYNKDQSAFVTDVFDLQKYERETYDKLTDMVMSNRYKDIVWRD